jgi:hypothetical protein
MALLYPAYRDAYDDDGDDRCDYRDTVLSDECLSIYVGSTSRQCQAVSLVVLLPLFGALSVAFN